MAIGIDAILASKVGFASHQNAVPVIRELKLKSEASQPIEHCELQLTADPQFLHGKKWLIDRLSPGDELQRAGRLIRDRVLKIAKLKHYVSTEGGPEPFVWLDAASHQSIIPARYPAGEEDIRQIEEISLSELRGSRSNDPTEIARNFGVRRLSAAARSRIELALSS